jgi:polyphosphate kinase 2 (PPK2 family)
MKFKVKDFEAGHKTKNPLKHFKTQLKPVDGGDEGAEKALKKSQEDLAGLQELLYAQNEWAVLVVLQGPDTAGKDGLIKHVMKGVNPTGCEVTAFKAPTHHELDHDFLWRAHVRMPARGMIGVFNRSYYEDIRNCRARFAKARRQKFWRNVAKTSWRSKSIWPVREP